MLLKLIHFLRTHNFWWTRTHHFLPVVGVWLLDWQVFPILILFQIELVLGAVFLIVKLIVMTASYPTPENQNSTRWQRSPSVYVLGYFVAAAIGFLAIQSFPGATSFASSKSAPWMDVLFVPLAFPDFLRNTLQPFFESTNQLLVVLINLLFVLTLIIFYICIFIFYVPVLYIIIFTSLNWTYLIAVIRLICYEASQVGLSLKPSERQKHREVKVRKQAQAHLAIMFVVPHILHMVVVATASPLAGIGFLSLFTFLNDILNTELPSKNVKTGLPQSRRF
jgi:hypothetical protein